MLQERILVLEDIAALSENFGMGIHLVLLRRYNRVGRPLKFNLKMDDEKSFIGDEYAQLRNGLFAVMSEIATNDLKYGRGESQWNLKLAVDEIRITMTANTDYELGKYGTGMGTSTINRRIIEMGGKVCTELTGKYKIEFHLKPKPISQNN